MSSHLTTHTQPSTASAKAAARHPRRARRGQRLRRRSTSPSAASRPSACRAPPTTSRSPTTTPTWLRDSHAHFYGGVYLGIAIFLIVASTNLHKYRTALNVVFAVIFLGGVARLTQLEPASRSARTSPCPASSNCRHARHGALARRRHPDTAHGRRPISPRITRLTHHRPTTTPAKDNP